MRYTAQQLADEAKARGFKNVSKRLVFDWEAKGLLDEPRRGAGLGRGIGQEPATWPEEQLQLFLTELGKRESLTQIVPLFNIPVWLWLFWGDNYVPLRQVRRTLHTWGGINRTSASYKAKATANEIVRDLGHPRATAKARRAFVSALSLMITSGKFDSSKLLPLFKPVFDPEETGLPRGPAGLPITAEGVLQLLQARITVLENVLALPDSFFEWARFTNAAALGQYMQDQPYLVEDADLGHLFTRPGLQDLFNSSCQRLISVLGMGVLMLAQIPDGSLNHPATWLNFPLKTVIRPIERPDGVVTAFDVELQQRRKEK